MNAVTSGSLALPGLPPGRILPPVHAPSPFLSSPCEEIDPRDPISIQLAADLLATMAAAPGCVGLAANQLGVAFRAFSLDVSNHPKTRTCHGKFVLLNAVIEDASRNERAREGCLSVPDFTGDVKRATRLTVRGQIPGTRTSVVITTDAFEARALQHEIDHTDGLLFLDRVAGAQAIHVRQTYL